MNPTSTAARQLIGQYLEALSGQRKTPDLVAEFVSDPHLAAHIRDVEAAFPEYQLIADDLIAERDLVAMRGTFRGVHRGPFAGIPATGKAVSSPLMIIYRVRDNHIVEHWLQFDGAALVAQLQAHAVGAQIDGELIASTRAAENYRYDSQINMTVPIHTRRDAK